MPTYDIDITCGDLKSDKLKTSFESLAKLLFKDRYIDSPSAYIFREKDEVKRDFEYGSHSEFWVDDEGQLHAPNTKVIEMKVYYRPDEIGTTSALIAHSTGSVYGSPTGIDRNGWFGEPIILEVGKDDLDVEYTMANGEKWKVSDAVKYAEDFINCKELKSFEPSECTYEAQYVVVCLKSESEEEYGYYVAFSRKDENGNYLTTMDYSAESDLDTGMNKIMNNEPFYFGTMHEVEILEPNVIYRFSKGYSLEYLEETNSENDFITLSKAISILDEELASQLALNFPCAELSYAISCKGYPVYVDFAEYIDDTAPEYAYYSNAYCTASCEFEIRPVWAFRDDNLFANDKNSKQSYYVDAITGEVSKIQLL